MWAQSSSVKWMQHLNRCRRSNLVRRRELGNFKSANAGAPGISRGPGATQSLQESPECWPPGRTSRATGRDSAQKYRNPSVVRRWGGSRPRNRPPPANTGRTTFSQAAEVMWWGNESLSNTCCANKLDLHMEKNEPWALAQITHRNEFEMNHGHICKSKRHPL